MNVEHDLLGPCRHGFVGVKALVQVLGDADGDLVGMIRRGLRRRFVGAAFIFEVEAFSNIQHMETADSRSISITLGEPDSEFLSYLTTAVPPPGWASSGPRIR